MSKSKTLYIIDHDGELARSLASSLSSHDLSVEIRSSGEEFLANVAVERAVCVLIEKHAPGISVSEIQARLRLRGVAIPVIQIDGSTPGPQTGDAMEGGSSEPLRRRGDAKDAGTVATGEPRLAAGEPAGAAAVLPEIEILRERLKRLTSREREVAQLVAQGYSSKELARALNLSRSTVDNHRARILEKLQLGNFVQVTRFLSMLAAEE